VIGSMALTLVAVLTAPIVSETIDVARIGPVDLKPFTCSDTPRSTVIQRVCYARSQRLMIVNAHGIYRASCDVPQQIYRVFITAGSMGQFYQHAIGGNPAFRCRFSGSLLTR
jgi:hypothetical protein